MTKETPPVPAPMTATEAPNVPIHLRPARPDDVPALVSLLLRLKRLNEEFDPLLKVRADAEARATALLTQDLADPKALVLAAEGIGADKDRVVGIVRAHLRERLFYTPENEGVILDIYLLPLYRRHGVGEYLLRETVQALKARGAGIVTAEFPAHNEIATKFYGKRGFRAVTLVHAKSL